MLKPLSIAASCAKLTDAGARCIRCANRDRCPTRSWRRSPLAAPRSSLRSHWPENGRRTTKSHETQLARLRRTVLHLPQPPRIQRRGTLLIIVEIDEDIDAAAPPANDALVPVAQCRARVAAAV